MWALRIFPVIFSASAILFLWAFTIISIQASPFPKALDIETEMRLIPQNHCLRFRKFDLIKRCRRYRVRRHH